MLLHICCAPCSTATVESWRLEGADITGAFFNPNIHPFSEHRRRHDTLLAYAGEIGLPLAGEPLYDVAGWLKRVAGSEEKGKRCRICISQRLLYTAALAARGSFDTFSTTLLISPYQEHEIIMEEGLRAEGLTGVEFAYLDLRPQYRRSREMSQAADLYRQNYCGCIFSEGEAALARSRKLKSKKAG